MGPPFRRMKMKPMASWKEERIPLKYDLLLWAVFLTLCVKWD
jgi:hypothetical protein